MRAMASAEATPRAGRNPVKVATRRGTRHRHATAEGDSADAAGDAGEGNWGIQVGAYSQSSKARHAAETAWRKLGRLVANGQISVARSKGHHQNHIYRARLIGLPEHTAYNACHRLSRKHMACKVINLSVKVAAQ